MKATFPFRGTHLANERFRLALLLIYPKLLGPINLIFASLSLLDIRSSNFLPSSPVSLKPAEIISTVETFFSIHWSTTLSTNCDGITIHTRSTLSFIETISGKHTLLPIFLYLGLTGKSFPLYPPSNILLNMTVPIFSSSFETPTTAMLLGDIIFSFMLIKMF